MTWDDISTVDDRPIGWHDDQQPVHYRLEQKHTSRVFDVVHGPESIKRETFTSGDTLITNERTRERVFSQTSPPTASHNGLARRPNL